MSVMFKAVAYAGNYCWHELDLGSSRMKTIISYLLDKQGVTKKYVSVWFSAGSAERGATHHLVILTPTKPKRPR